MRIHLITVGYDSGHAGTRMGRGPDAFLNGGLAAGLERRGHTVELRRVEDHARFPTEVATAFRLTRGVAAQVRAALWRRAFPLVLTGNCFAALGVAAGLGNGRRGLLWLDAHGDLHTPETTTTGFLDGMALASALGHCWAPMAGTIDGFTPLASEDVLLVGAHDIDRGEGDRFLTEGGTILGPNAVRDGRAEEAITKLAPEADRLSVHLDLDVLDVAEGRANGYAAAGGLTRADLLSVLAAAVATGRVTALTLSAYDPAVDVDGSVLAIAMEAVDQVVASL